MAHVVFGECQLFDLIFVVLCVLFLDVFFCFIIIIITRLLGVEDFGRFTFALSFVALFAILADLGLNTLTIREVAREKDKAAKYFTNGAFLKLLL